MLYESSTCDVDTLTQSFIYIVSVNYLPLESPILQTNRRYLTVPLVSYFVPLNCILSNLLIRESNNDFFP